MSFLMQSWHCFDNVTLTKTTQPVDILVMTTVLSIPQRIQQFSLRLLILKCVLRGTIFCFVFLFVCLLLLPRKVSSFNGNLHYYKISVLKSLIQLICLSVVFVKWFWVVSARVFNVRWLSMYAVETVQDEAYVLYSVGNLLSRSKSYVKGALNIL